MTMRMMRFASGRWLKDSELMKEMYGRMNVTVRSPRSQTTASERRVREDG